MRKASRKAPRIALALAGGGPLGAIHEIGALCALEEALDGLAFTGLQHYVGVSAGGFIAAALANGLRLQAAAPPAMAAFGQTTTGTIATTGTASLPGSGMGGVMTTGTSTMQGTTPVMPAPGQAMPGIAPAPAMPAPGQMIPGVTPAQMPMAPGVNNTMQAPGTVPMMPQPQNAAGIPPTVPMTQTVPITTTTTSTQ